MEEKNKLIEELKQIMLDMYRNAGSLDMYIQYLEGVELDRSEYSKTYIQAQYACRMDQKRTRNYSSLDAREKSVWERLILEADPDRVIEEQES